MAMDEINTASAPPSELNERVGPLLECAPLATITLEGTDLVVSEVNAMFCALLRKPRVELVGRHFADLVPEGAACVSLLRGVYKAGVAAESPEPDRVGSEASIWVHALWPTLDADRHPVRVIIQLMESAAFHRDVTAMNEALLVSGLRQHELREEAEGANAKLTAEVETRLRVEIELRAAKSKLLVHAEALEQAVAARTAELRAAVGDLEAFSYSLAHDLRAPVRAIRSFTLLTLEMDRAEVGPAAAELLQRVVKASIRMDSLIQDVLSLSLVIRRPIVVLPVDVDALVRALVNERPELSSPGAVVRIDGPLLPMLGHEATLSQCLTNLLGNAVKFVERGVVPEVRVWTEEVATPRSSETALSGDNAGRLPARPTWVRLWVEDHGIGIDLKAQASIFEIFQRLHTTLAYEGTGIGLAIVRKAIERMGGRVGVESEVGKGSRFWLELPRG